MILWNLAFTHEIQVTPIDPGILDLDWIDEKLWRGLFPDVALNLSAAKVSGDIYIGKIVCDGRIAIRSAVVHKAVVLWGVHINNTGMAVDAERLKANGFVLGGHSVIEGDIKINNARLDHCVLEDITWTHHAGDRHVDIDVSYTVIGRELTWRGISFDKSVPEVRVNFTAVEAGILRDDGDSWLRTQQGHEAPVAHTVDIDGLVYEAVQSEMTTRRRLEWLDGQKQFRPQPYEQFAAVRRKEGRDEDATQILIAKERRRPSQSVSAWCWKHISGLIIGNGYRPWRALWYIVGSVLLGTVVFGRAFRAGLITATREQSQRFNAFVYSLDVFVPLVKLHQVDFWLPDAKAGKDVDLRIRRIKSGAIVRVYFWIHIVAGWSLSTILALALSGLVQR